MAELHAHANGATYLRKFGNLSIYPRDRKPVHPSVRTTNKQVRLTSAQSRCILLCDRFGLSTDRELRRVKKRFQGSARRVKMGEGEEKIRLHAAIVCLANALHWIDGSSDWCGSGSSIASCQSRPHRNIHFPGLRLGTFLIS